MKFKTKMRMLRKDMKDRYGKEKTEKDLFKYKSNSGAVNLG